MRVYVLGRALPAANSSTGQFEFEQAVALSRQQGVSVSYFFFDDRSILYNKTIRRIHERREGIDCFGCSLPIGGLPWSVFCSIKTRSLIRIFDEMVDANGLPDVVHVHFPAICMTSAFAESLTSSGIPFVCTEHWSRVQDNTLDPNRRATLIGVAKECSEFICVSRDLSESVQRITEIDASKLHVIPNLVQESLFYVRDRDREPFHHDGPIRYVSAGRLEAGKGFEALLSAFSKLPADRPRELIIAGDGSQRKALKKLANRLGINEVVRFVGWQSRETISELFACSDCYVSASPKETFGVPYAEAWMCGVPCIGPDNNPLRALFKKDRGRLFPVDDSDALAECIHSLEIEGTYFSSNDIAVWAEGLFSSDIVGERIKRVLETACSDDDDKLCEFA